MESEEGGECLGGGSRTVGSELVRQERKRERGGRREMESVMTMWRKTCEEKITGCGGHERRQLAVNTGRIIICISGGRRQDRA